MLRWSVAVFLGLGPDDNGLEGHEEHGAKEVDTGQEEDEHFEGALAPLARIHHQHTDVEHGPYHGQDERHKRDCTTFYGAETSQHYNII